MLYSLPPRPRKRPAPEPPVQEEDPPEVAPVGPDDTWQWLEVLDVEMASQLKLGTGGISSDKVVLGTDCSGLDTFKVALDAILVNGGKDVVHAFASDNRLWARKFLKTHNPGLCIMCSDITKRPNKHTPYVDIYCASLPNNGQYTAQELSDGVDNPHGKDIVTMHVLNYIKEKSPKAFLLESKAHLYSASMKPEMAAVYGYLQKKLTTESGGPSYHVWSDPMDARCDGGLPQASQRMFFVGILKTAVDTMAISNPLTLSQMEAKSLADVLDPYVAPLFRPDFNEPPGLSAAQLRNYKKVKDWLEPAVDVKAPNPPGSQIIISDLSVGPKRDPDTLRGCSIGLTPSRPHGYFIWGRQRFMTTTEMEKLQGIPNDHFKYDGIISENQYKKLVAEAPPVPIVGRVLRKILAQMKLPGPAGTPLPDPWCPSSGWAEEKSEFFD